MAISKIPSAGFQDNVKFRNIIINGDMSIAQRGTSKANIGFEYGTVDRFKTLQGSLGAFTQSQSTDVPTGQGFAKSLKMDCTTADASPSSSDYLQIRQQIEGQNLQYLKKGTVNAESLTVSFWVKSNKTGTYIIELFDHDNNRHINKSYTILSASTWEKKTLTFSGDTTGAFDNDINASLSLFFMLGAGSDYTSGTLQTSWGSNTSANRQVGQVNLADSTDNEWYITGVQLEAGTTASDFEFLPVDVNFDRCKRYYQKYQLHYLNLARFNGSSGNSITQFTFSKEMRSAPTFSTSGTWTSSAGYIGTPAGSTPQTTSIIINGPSIGANEIEYAGGTNAFIILDSEL